MIYEIKFTGADQDDGSIELERLALLSHNILNIAKGALQIRLLGISTERGRPSENITRALKIKLKKLKKGSTILELECDTFQNTLKGLQGDFFKEEILNELPQMTPMSLVINSYHEALSDGEKNNLDRALLKSLRDIRKLLIDDEEQIIISNRGSIPKLKLKKKDFRKIELLEEESPIPQQVIVNGIVELLQYSKSRIIIHTSEGVVNGYLSEQIVTDDISKYWGKEITVAGTANYKSNGRMSFIEVERLFAPGKEDAYFSHIKMKDTSEQQLQKHLKDFSYTNGLKELVGKWPGDESLDEIIKSLD